MEGEEGFRRREAEVIAELTKSKGVVLATGGGTILNADNRRNLASRGLVVYLDASLEQQLKRLEHDKKRPLIQKSDDRKEILTKLREIRDPLYREIADLVFSTDERSVRSVANEVIRFLQESEHGA